MTEANVADPVAFSTLGLPTELNDALDDLGFVNCTQIQGLTLPRIMEGEDVAAQAQTGTGKTAAFLLGAFTRLLRTPPAEPSDGENGGGTATTPRLLVIAPTRELAIQISNDAEALAKYTDLRICLVYGGVDYEKQAKAISAGVDVLIGTPGRLIDYLKQRIYSLGQLEIVVLDEADRMFDLGFINDIRFLFRRMPAPGERTSLLFSATLSNRVMELAYEHMNNPDEVKTETTTITADGVEQTIFHPAQDEKVKLLIGLVRMLEPYRSIVFVNTKRAADRVEAYLNGNGIASAALSGDVRQRQREKILARFTAGELPVLIATDVAARGLHIPDVSHVFNYDLPQQAEDYVHRIGRTARAGATGEAISFACEEYSFSLPEIQDYIGQEIDFAPITSDLIQPLDKPRYKQRDSVDNSRRSGGRGGSRDRNNRGGDRSRNHSRGRPSGQKNH